MANILFLAGLTVFFILLTQEVVLPFAMTLGIKWGSVVSTLLLFTFPSILLGMVSPYAIRLKTQSVASSGETAGNLYAISTIGSIFGTFLAGFYLIPNFSSTQITLGLSFVLLVASLFGGIDKLKIFLLPLVVIALPAFTLLPSNFLLETDSAYNHIKVADLIKKSSGQNIRVLFLASESHSIIYLDHPDQIFTLYHRFSLLDSLFKPEIKKALTLGGGAYVGPINFLKRYPRAEMTAVEIDPKVTQVAKNYFNLKDDPRLKIYHQDGRIFLNLNQEIYDAVYGDAFSSSFSIPFQLTTKQAAQKIYDSLADDGIYILNLISSLQGEKSLFFQAEYKTLKEVFPQVYVFPTRYYQNQNLEKGQNIVMIATKNPQRFSRQYLEKNATAEQKELLKHWQEEVEISPDTRILTDNFAPVDYYISKLL